MDTEERHLIDYVGDLVAVVWKALAEAYPTAMTVQNTYLWIDRRYRFPDSWYEETREGSTDLVWRNRVRFARERLRENGFLADSPRGTWKLSHKGYTRDPAEAYPHARRPPISKKAAEKVGMYMAENRPGQLLALALKYQIDVDTEFVRDLRDRAETLDESIEVDASGEVIRIAFKSTQGGWGEAVRTGDSWKISGLD